MRDKIHVYKFFERKNILQITAQNNQINCNY